MEVTTDDVLPEFLAILLRTRHYRRAFRAINTGHSNRRRTQESDFNDVLVKYPPLPEQRAWVEKVEAARLMRNEGYSMIADSQDQLDAVLHAADEWDVEADDFG